jgi:hypothetical protein
VRSRLQRGFVPQRLRFRRDTFRDVSTQVRQGADLLGRHGNDLVGDRAGLEFLGTPSRSTTQGVSSVSLVVSTSENTVLSRCTVSLPRFGVR